MNNPTLSRPFATAIENELAGLGTGSSRLERNQRRIRVTTTALGTAAIAAVLTGGAIVINSFPGETTTVGIGSIVSGSYTGTARIELGAIPAGASAVILDVTCSDGGAMEVALNGANADGVSWNCSDPVFDGTVHIDDGKLPDPGVTFITVTADPGTPWAATAQYATTATTDWAVNDNGQTYGVGNAKGLPDLTPALATNGNHGYISTKELMAFAGEGTINVYESDGTTIIGEFTIGSD